MVYIIVNSAAAQHGSKDEAVKKASAQFTGKELSIRSATEIGTYPEFFASIDPSDEVVFIGGDGTMNVLTNAMKGTPIKNPVYLYKAGTGNDFLRDVFGHEAPDGALMQMNEYLQDLPTVTIKGKTYRFLNNVGFGIDGTVCTKGLELQERGATNINYTAIAIKSMMTFKTSNATVRVDGKEHHFKKVWLAPSMNGRYYGGGMMIAPSQDRSSDTISVVIFHGTGKLRTLMIFPKIFSGTHIRYKKNLTILTGHNIEVIFDRPQDVQIDGEVIRDVTTYTASKPAAVVAAASEEHHEEAATV